MSGAWCRVSMVSRGPASPTCRVCSCCARSCLHAVSSPGMPYALPTTAMLWMQSSTSSLFPFFRSCAMASFANCSCSTLAFSIVILIPPSLFWALPVSTQWHIHSACVSSNTNKKACPNSTFCRKNLGKAARNALGKGTGPLNLPGTAVGIFLSGLQKWAQKSPEVVLFPFIGTQTVTPLRGSGFLRSLFLISPSYAGN